MDKEHKALLSRRYADVILPLPLDGLFTYSVPEQMACLVRPMMRVVVPLGKVKTYMAVVVRVHEDVPEFKTRDILSVPDDMPILLERQHRLWQWIAQYYMCHLGEIMEAALPAGLKSRDAYRPKTVRCLRLHPSMRSEQSLHVALYVLQGSHKQREAFAAYLQLSHWDGITGDTPPSDVAEVAYDELMNVSGVSSSVVRSLVSRHFLETYEREVGRLQETFTGTVEEPSPLSEAQQRAYDELLSQMGARKVVLLHGVTSSGKTEIYIKLIDKVLREGRQVLYLLPEIALTVQIMRRLQRVFGARLGIYHSKYSDAERVEIWRKQLSDQPYDVILGARSAVFLPFRDLGLVIIDEEHETSFKQQDPAPRYHARSAAIMLAQMYAHSHVVLGTATPSMESYHNAMTGKYGYVSLTTRYSGVALPEILTVDVRDLRRRKIMRGTFSPLLISSMREALEGGRQVILFQNRRGFAPMIECRTCGWVPKCECCDVSLTYHKSLGVMTCHYCGRAYSVPRSCPCCEGTELMGRGCGTEKVEDALRELFPKARVARMDLDTTRSRNAYDRIISDFSAGKTDVLVGTQMVSKGLDFDNVSLVGILDADTMLNYPDFRAYEQAFAMMMQVSGRAGRRGERGTVLLQTRSADLPVIAQIVANDFRSFARQVLEERRMFRYPPFHRLVYVYLRHKSDDTVEAAAEDMAARLRQVFGDRVLGPDKPAVARVKSQCIRKVIVKLEQGIDLEKARACMAGVKTAVVADRRYAAVTVYFDVDPQ